MLRERLASITSFEQTFIPVPDLAACIARHRMLRLQNSLSDEQARDLAANTVLWLAHLRSLSAEARACRRHEPNCITSDLILAIRRSRDALETYADSSRHLADLRVELGEPEGRPDVSCGVDATRDPVLDAVLRHRFELPDRNDYSYEGLECLVNEVDGRVEVVLRRASPASGEFETVETFFHVPLTCPLGA